MRGLVLIGMLMLAGCGPAEPEWNPLTLPAAAERALKAELGDEVTFIVSRPGDAAKASGWICGIATVKGSGGRLFIFEQGTGTLNVQPETSGDMPQEQALQALSFMQKYQSCSASG